MCYRRCCVSRSAATTDALGRYLSSSPLPLPSTVTDGYYILMGGLPHSAWRLLLAFSEREPSFTYFITPYFSRDNLIYPLLKRERTASLKKHLLPAKATFSASCEPDA